MIGKIYPLGAKLKDTLYNGTIGRYTTKSHKEGEFSVTGDTFIIRKVTELEQKGRLNEIKEKYSSMYQKMQQMDNEFKKLIPTLFPKKYFRGISCPSGSMYKPSTLKGQLIEWKYLANSRTSSKL